MLTKRIKNTDTVDRTWVNQVVAPSAYYDIQGAEHDQFVYDATLLADIASGIAVVNNGTADITDVDSAIYYLQNGPLDALVKVGTGRTIFYDPIHFPTLQDAIDYCELLPESITTDPYGVTLILPAGNFSAESVLIKRNISLIGSKYTEIGTLTYRPSSATVGPKTALLRDLLITNLNILAETAAASGVFYPDMFYDKLFIDNCKYQTLIGNRIGYIVFTNCELGSNGETAVYTYCNSVHYRTCYLNDVDFHVDDSAANLPTDYYPSLFMSNTTNTGEVSLFRDGGATNAFLESSKCMHWGLILNGNCNVFLIGSSVDKPGLSLLNSNNTFDDREHWGMYRPAVPGNYIVEPKFYKDALDELATRPSLVDGDKGDITVSASGVTWTVDNDVVTNAKAANMATKTYKGRTTAGTGDPEDLSIATLKTDLSLDLVNNTMDTNKILSGEVTGTLGATVIANDIVSNGKLANVLTQTFKGRTTAGTGDPEDLTIAEAKALLNLAGSNTGDQTNISGNAATVTTNADLTGDVTSVGNAATIAANAVTNAKAAQMATKTYKGRTTAGTGNAEDVSVATLKADLSLNNVDNSSDASKVIAGDVGGVLSACTITNNVVTNAKMADVPTATFKGRNTAGTGDPEDLNVGQAKILLNLANNNTGDQTISLTGDVTGTGTGTFAVNIANNAVTNDKMALMATKTYKGRTGVGTNIPEDVPVATLKSDLVLVKADVGLGNVDNTADSAKTLAGDITGTLGASTVANDAITNAKLANVPTQTFKGRTTAATGDPEDLTLAQAKALLIDANPRTILRSEASHIAAKVAGTYALASADAAAVSGTGTLYTQSLIHIAAADYVSKNNAAVKLRLKCMCLVNDVAPTGNFTFGLYPVTRPGTSGGAGVMIYTLGTVVASSNGAVFTTPAADSMAQASSADFALPADGFYAIGVVTTATIATSSLVHLIADLQVVNA